MESYVENAPCLIFSTSDEGIILEVNEFMCNELMYDKSQLVGNKVEKVLTVASQIFQQTHFFPLLKLHGFANEIYITFRKSDGEHLPVLLNARRKLVSDKAVSTYVGITVHNRKKFEDELIAARKKAENASSENQELQAAKADLQHHAEELDKQIYLVKKQNAELKQFSKLVSHDLQEPLRKISIYSGLLLERTGDSYQQATIDKIRKVSRRMRDILLGLQQYVWLNEAPLIINTHELQELVDHAKTLLKKSFPGIAFELQLKNNESISGSREQLELLIFHLLSNAVRFRDKEKIAQITIEAHRLQRNQFTSIAGRYKYVDFVRIAICDNGLGFDAEFTPQLFDLFRTLHPQSGSGVGLSICKKIVENHRGTISIDSHINKGTKVTVELPVFPEKGNMTGHSALP